MRSSIYMIVVVACVASLRSEGSAFPVNSKAAYEEADKSVCDCYSSCSGCAYDVKWFQVGSGPYKGKYCYCTCNCGSTNPAPSTPQVPSSPLTPEVPSNPWVPFIPGPNCGTASANLGICVGEFGTGVAFQNKEIGKGCCRTLKQWSSECFAGNNQISNGLPYIMLHYCGMA